MQKLSCQEIRNKWIEFFTKKCSAQHKHIVSASLVPDNPTLLLNSAGMVQFVPIFTGTKPAPEPPRAVTIQKCARVGGKDSDLENIGRTTRHHSFFEMLGNFSFGDYFKNEAIAWAWTFVREELGMEADRLYVSIFAGDDQNEADAEAEAIWMKVLEKDFPDETERKARIWKMGRKDNFWGPPGKSGPCGPCSEIYFDTFDRHCEEQSDEAIQKLPELGSEEFDNRFVEIWNLVFMEFFKDDDAKFSPLDKKNIDTGAGLERIATILQGVNNSFETNELMDILNKLANDLGQQYGSSEETDVYLKIITDHLRCLCFLIADGVRPSNMGRGYVLRMIIRRAARFAYLMTNKAEACLFKHCQSVIDNYVEAYPELNMDIASICRKEEEAFAKTITNGLKILEAKISSVCSESHSENSQVQGLRNDEERSLLDVNERSRNERNAAIGDFRVGSLDGEFVFDLYSTYGFPLELTKDIADEKNIEIDLDAYEEAKAKHSQVSNTGAFDTSVESNAQIAEILKEHGKTEFIGYDELETKAKVVAVLDNRVALDRTTFYAESGGQLADRGQIAELEVSAVKNIEGIFLHSIDDVSGLRVGDEVELKVDAENRQLTRYHHSACHLLQAALRKVLGDDVQQMGSQVGAEYTRFDFNLDRAMTKEEVAKTEALVNTWIEKKLPVETRVMAFDEAVSAGALSFFEEKYEDDVRVLFMGDDSEMASIELCGGTHVSNLEEISKAVIAQEGSVAAGIRRIKMLCNTVADDYIKERDELAKQKAAEEAAQAEAKAQAKALKKEQAKLAMSKLDDFAALSLPGAEGDKAIQTLIININETFPDGLDADAVKTLVEALTDKLKPAFVFAANASDGKLMFFASASQELVAEKDSPYNAANAVRTAAQICGGGGGGRPNFAQAGGKDLSKLNEALEAVKELVIASAAPSQ